MENVNVFHGHAIYEAQGKAGEYSRFACNFYNGCTHDCDYCYNNHGINAAVVGGTIVRLKKTLGDEDTAYRIFCSELDRVKDQIKASGYLHFNFVSDPCLSQTIALNWRCIDYALSQNVPCQVLTKRADWLGDPAVQYALSNHNGLLKVGFSLTGCDDQERGASPNLMRIDSMRVLHQAGIQTFASIEPILDPLRSLDMIKASLDCCDEYKIGIRTGEKKYTPQDVCNMVVAVKGLNPKRVYWKKSLIEFCQKAIRPNTHMTVSARIYAPDLVLDVEIDDVLECIRTGQFYKQNLRGITQQIQAEPNHDEQNKMKYSNLPVASFNGTFSYRSDSDITGYSSFTAMDFDGFTSEEELQKIGRRLVKTPCVYAVFRTPGGRGLKAIVMHDNDNPDYHTELYGQLLAKFQITNADPSVCDLSRGNYLCYDPNLWKNELCIPYHFVHDPAYTPKPRAIQRRWTGMDIIELQAILRQKRVMSSKSDQSVINILNSHWQKNPNRWKVGNRANSVFQSASELCNFGVDIGNALEYLSQAYLPTGLPQNEINYQAIRGYMCNVMNYGTKRHRFDGYGYVGRGGSF